GRHEVRLSKPGFRELSHRVAVQPGQKARVSLNLKAVKGVLQVAARIAGARVIVDGRDVGGAPLKDFEVEPGQRRIRLEAPGHQPVEEVVRVKAGKEYALFAAGAAPLPELPTLAAAEPPPKDPGAGAP